MPMLRDIFNRSALKKGVDRDLPHGAEVFEVTDLLIPAGTLWEQGDHPIGEVEVPMSSGVAYYMAIEISEPLQSADAVSVWERNGFLVLPFNSSLETGLWRTISGMDNIPFETWEPTDPLPETKLLQFELRCDSGGLPLENDVHVVRARAAFLVI